MSTDECIQMLEAHGIKPTANRILIARVLGDAPNPMSMTEIETALETVDKSVISRSLALFGSAHLLHRIDAGGEGALYELCRRSHDRQDGGDDDMHVHFYCELCRKTFCMEDIPVPHVGLPDGYEAVSVNYIASGLCPACASRTRKTNKI